MRVLAVRGLPLSLALWAFMLMVPAGASGASVLAVLQVGQPGELNGPIDLTLDAEGNVIVADSENHRVVKLARDGSVLWSRGRAGNARGTGPGEFSRPKDVAVGADGAVYVADSDNGRVQKLSAGNGAFVSSFELSFDPQAITTDADGTMWLADSSADRVVQVNQAGAVLRTIGGTGEGPGQFRSPFDVSVAGGFLYVADALNRRIQKFRTDGSFVLLWGAPVQDSLNPKPGEFERPNGVSATADGRVYVIDRGTARLDQFSAEGAPQARFGDQRQLASPGGVFARGDDVVIADTGNSRVVRLLNTETPPPGAFCESQTGACGVGPNGVPVVSMANGDRSAVRFVTPLDACERLGRGTHSARQVFFGGRTYELQAVPEGYMVEIPPEDLTGGGSVIASWTCPGSGGSARSAQLGQSVVNETMGDVSLYDPSGFVRDSKTRRGIPDATVTLESSPSFSGPFGFADPLSISPRINPQKTDSKGHYGWDVPDGFYRISVTRFGYRTLKASRVVTVPPPVTDLHVRLRRKPSEQRRLIETRGSVGRLRLGMARAAAQRAARGLRPRPRLAFRRGRLSRIRVVSSRFKTGAGVGPRSTEADLRIAYGRRVKRRARGGGATYRIGSTTFSVAGSNLGTGRVRAVTVAR